MRKSITRRGFKNPNKQAYDNLIQQIIKVKFFVLNKYVSFYFDFKIGFRKCFIIRYRTTSKICKSSI